MRVPVLTELGFYVRRQKLHGIPGEVEQEIRQALPLAGLWEGCEEGGLECFVTVDLHHGLSPEISADELVYSAIALESEGMHLQVPCPEWAVFLTVYKLYWESVQGYERGGYQYADLVRLLPKFPESAVAPLLGLFARYKLEVAAYYVLRRLPRNFGVPMPAGLYDFLIRLRTIGRHEDPQQCNDLGDAWPKLWGLR